MVAKIGHITNKRRHSFETSEVSEARGQKRTSISAALSRPKKTFLMNFPRRNTNTKAWMYNTWHTGETHQHVFTQPPAEGKGRPRSASFALALPPCWGCSWWGRPPLDRTGVWGDKRAPPLPQSAPDWWQSPGPLVPSWTQLQTGRKEQCYWWKQTNTHLCNMCCYCGHFHNHVYFYGRRSIRPTWRLLWCFSPHFVLPCN